MWSLPLRKCGLKSCICWPISVPSCHFPCGSVDWNMAFCASSDLTNRSLPLRKCGLKWLKMFCTFVLCWVTSLAEVWIEICRYLFLIIPHLSLPLRKCGLKWLSLSGNRLLFCHFPCGSVDWNICEVGVGVGVWVTSLAEVWIEILSRSTYGNPRSKCYHHKYYKDLLKSLDLPDIHFHQLRNTYATILLKNSFNSKGVSHL